MTPPRSQRLIVVKEICVIFVNNNDPGIYSLRQRNNIGSYVVSHHRYRGVIVQIEKLGSQV